MTKSIEQRIRDIVDNKTNEKAFIDYKMIEYDLSSKKKWEVVKDVIAMLNSEEAYGEDKFIIFGVVDATLYIKGLENKMTDDSEYQHLFEFIKPRPRIETGEVVLRKKRLGYVFIKKDNNERPYSVKQDNEKYCEGTSFIRKGSINLSLDEETREKLTLEKYISNPSWVDNVYQNILNQNNINSEMNYKNEDFEGNAKINPSNNNGKFTFGKRMYEFNIKFDVANNNVARIYNDYQLQISRIKNCHNLFHNVEQLDFKKLDFSNRFRRYSTDDLAIVVNKMGKYALLVFKKIESESHGADSDIIEFKWKTI